MRTKILGSLLLAPSLALASGDSLPNANPRDLSMSAAAVAAQRDAGAAYTLPAALARLHGPSVDASFGLVNIFDTWKDPNGGQKIDMNTATAAFGGLHAAYGGKLPLLGDRGWGVGVGFQPFGGAIVSWPSSWPGRYRILDVNRRVFSAVASVGLEVVPQVRVGGGLVYYYTWQKFSRDVYQGPPLGPAGTPDATGALKMSGGGPSYDLSAEIDPLRDVPLTVAVDYKHKARQHLSGTVRWSNLVLPPTLSPIFQNQDAKERLTIPNTLNVGAAYRVARPLLLAATFTLDRWVVYDQDLFTGSAPGAALAVPRHYRNGQTYRVGAEWDVARDWQLRAGVQRDVSGLRKEFYAPDLPDQSSWGGSLGASYWFAPGVHADLGVFYAKMDRVTAANASPTEPVLLPGDTRAFRGTYTPSALVYGLALGWTPGAAR